MNGETCRFFSKFMVPTGTGNQGKPGKMGRHFPVREFCQDWKSQGILPKILEKQENLNFHCPIWEKLLSRVMPQGRNIRLL